MALFVVLLVMRVLACSVVSTIVMTAVKPYFAANDNSYHFRCAFQYSLCVPSFVNDLLISQPCRLEDPTER